MPPFIRRAKRVVETHCDIADEQTAGVRDFQAAGLEFHQAVGGERREQRQFLFKMLFEVDAEFLRHRGEIEREIAHGAHDGFAADLVLAGHEIGLVQRHLAGIHGGLPLRQFLLILPVRSRHLRNTAHAERVNIRTGARAVALEIPLQLFPALRQGQFVSRLREVIHADEDILIVGREPLDDQFQHGEFGFRRGQNFVLENFLGASIQTRQRIQPPKPQSPLCSPPSINMAESSSVSIWDNSSSSCGCL